MAQGWLKGAAAALWDTGCFRTIQKGGGLRPPPFWMVLKHPGAAQNPKTTDFHPNPQAPLGPAEVTFKIDDLRPVKKSPMKQLRAGYLKAVWRELLGAAKWP